MKCGLDDLNETLHDRRPQRSADLSERPRAGDTGLKKWSRPPIPSVQKHGKTLQVQKFIQQKSGLPWKKITLPEGEKGALTVELNEEEIPLLNLFGSYFPPRSLLRLLSFRHVFSRNPECLKFRTFWIPACAGMTVFQEPEGQEPDGQACAIA